MKFNDFLCFRTSTVTSTVPYLPIGHLQTLNYMKLLMFSRHLQDVGHLREDVCQTVDVSPIKSTSWEMSEMFTPKGGDRDNAITPLRCLSARE